MTDKILELEIIDLAYDGKSVANNDGKVVFLNGGLPGELVEAQIRRSKPRYDEGIVTKILRPSPDRHPAPCEHFANCGGCTWQDLDYDAQLKFKKKQVEECVHRLGKFEDFPVHDIIGSVELFDYRNKMEFSFNVAEDDSFTLGLHERGRFDKIFDINHCHIQSELASEIVRWFRKYVKDNEIPVYDVLNHGGYMRFLMIRQMKRTDNLMINIVTNYGDFPDSMNLIKELTEKFPQITTIVHNQNGQKSNIATGEIEKVLYGKGYIEEKLFNCTFRIRANSFFQTNSIQTETLYRTAFDLLDPSKTDRLLDLYCGTGSIGILVSPYVKEVIGVELVADAIVNARENAELNNIENIKFFEGNVKDFLSTPDATEGHFDIVMVDPPRAGINPKALKRMLTLVPEKICYISCNPATFARDARQICNNGYELKVVRPIDMFPHTRHIELATIFHKI